MHFITLVHCLMGGISFLFFLFLALCRRSSTRACWLVVHPGRPTTTMPGHPCLEVAMLLSLSVAACVAVVGRREILGGDAGAVDCPCIDAGSYCQFAGSSCPFKGTCHGTTTACDCTTCGRDPFGKLDPQCQPCDAPSPSPSIAPWVGPYVFFVR